ncbi:hypothetical protein K523DRAFT_132413 [Schizophyllum commune Tattone D]|nr:hypothetical protein K523DRAFT_132413 [Schizophyllum commune Tattone D]
MEVKRKGPWIRGRHIVQRPNKGSSPSPHESTWLKFPQPSVPLFAGSQQGSSGVIAIVAGNDPSRPPDQEQSKTCLLSVSPSAFCDTVGSYLGFLTGDPHVDALLLSHMLPRLDYGRCATPSLACTFLVRLAGYRSSVARRKKARRHWGDDEGSRATRCGERPAYPIITVKDLSCWLDGRPWGE